MTATVSMKEALSCSNYFLSMYNPQKKVTTIEIEIDEQIQLGVLNYHIQVNNKLLENIYIISKKEALNVVKICKEIEESIAKVKGKKISPYNSVNIKFNELINKSLEVTRIIQKIANYEEVDETSKDYNNYWASMIKKNKNEKRIFGKKNVLKLIR